MNNKIKIHMNKTMEAIMKFKIKNNLIINKLITLIIYQI